MAVAKKTASVDDFEHYADQVSISIRVLLAWGIEHGELVRSFGIDAHSVGSPEVLEQRLHEMCSYDVMKRCELIFGIKTLLEALFPHDNKAQREWLAAEEELLKHTSPKSCIVFGDIEGIRDVFSVLEKLRN